MASPDAVRESLKGTLKVQPSGDFRKSQRRVTQVLHEDGADDEGLVEGEAVGSD